MLWSNRYETWKIPIIIPTKSSQPIIPTIHPSGRLSVRPSIQPYIQRTKNKDNQPVKYALELFTVYDKYLVAQVETTVG